MIVSEGSPGATSSIVKLSAHLCGFSLCQINASSMSGTPYTMANFRNDLVSAYRRAGVKVIATDSFLFVCLCVFCFYFVCECI